MIKKPSTKKVSLSLSLKWPLNYPLPVFPSISHTYNEWQKIHNLYEKPKYKCRCDRSLPRFQFTEKWNNWNSEKVYLVVCHCLLIVCGCLLVVCDRLWWFLVVCGCCLFSNYEVYETSIIFGEEIHLSDQSSWFQKVMSDLIQLHGTVTSSE